MQSAAESVPYFVVKEVCWQTPHVVVTWVNFLPIISNNKLSCLSVKLDDIWLYWLATAFTDQVHAATSVNLQCKTNATDGFEITILLTLIHKLYNYL